MAVFGLRDDGMILVASGFVDPEQFVVGELPIDSYSVFGALSLVNAEDHDDQLLVGFLAGTLTLDQAGTGAGDPVSGTIAADVVGPEFWHDE